jgi:hypothetical protein
MKKSFSDRQLGTFCIVGARTMFAKIAPLTWLRDWPAGHRASVA